MSSSRQVIRKSNRIIEASSIAIIGGGFAGLSVACNADNSEISIYDSSVAGMGGASSVATGLMHPITPQGKIIWKGLEGLEELWRTLDSIGDKESMLSSFEIIRPCFKVEHKENFQAAARVLPNVRYGLSFSS